MPGDGHERSWSVMAGGGDHIYIYIYIFFIYLFIYLFMYLFIYLSIYLFVYLLFIYSLYYILYYSFFHMFDYNTYCVKLVFFYTILLYHQNLYLHCIFRQRSLQGIMSGCRV